MGFNTETLITNARDDIQARLAAIETLNDTQRAAILAMIEEEIRAVNPGFMQLNFLGDDNIIMQLLSAFLGLLSGQGFNMRNETESADAAISRAMDGVFERMTATDQDPEVQQVASYVTNVQPGRYNIRRQAEIPQRLPTDLDQTAYGALVDEARVLRAAGTSDGQDTPGPEGTSPPVNTGALLAEAPVEQPSRQT